MTSSGTRVEAMAESSVWPLDGHVLSQPCVIRSSWRAPICTEELLFTCLLGACQDFINNVRSDSLVFYKDGASRICDIEEYLPQTADVSLRDYILRIERQFPRGELAVMTFGCQKYAVTLFQRALDIVKPVVDAVGIPDGGFDVDCFFGNYARTPHGIHHDPTSNLSFPVFGKKRYLFWPPETFPFSHSQKSVTLRTTQYEQYIDRAIVLDAVPGDIVYWPMGYWHMAVSDGSWSASVNIAGYFNRPAQDHVIQLIRSRHLRLSGVAYEMSASAIGSGTLSLAEEYESALNDVRDDLASTSLRRAIVGRWLRRQSASGFEIVPDLDVTIEAPSNKTPLVLREPSRPILCATIDSEILVAANGHVAEISRDSVSERAIKVINSGIPFTIQQLNALAESVNEAASHDLTMLCQYLIGARALAHSV